MKIFRFCLLRPTLLITCLSLFLGACSSNRNDRDFNGFVREGNNLLEKEQELTAEWKAEHIKIVKPEIRAQFPANREALRPTAEKLIELLARKQELSRQAAEKFENAGRHAPKDAQKQFAELLAESFEVNVEIDELFKEQAKLILDDAVTDALAYETRANLE